MRIGTLTVVAAIALAGVGATLLWSGSSSAPAAATPAAAPPPRDQPVARLEPAIPAEAIDAPAPVDDAVYPESDEPATTEPTLTAAERAPKMAQAVALLDDAIARAQADLDAAELDADADPATARRLRVKLARLRAVRDERARELAELR